MLKGQEFGKAIREAIKMKIASGAIRSQAEVARAFGVKPPSVSDWIKKGSIEKSRLHDLWRYFSDVAGPEHWGLDARDWPFGLSTGRDPEQRQPEQPWPLPAIPREKIEALAKDPAKLERLQGAVGMALAMLETGAGAVPTQRVPAPKAANDGTFEAIRKLPVKIAATISGVAPNDIHVEGSGTFLVPTAWVRSKGLNPESLIAVEVKGMSMYPRVHEGDTVVLNVADKQRQVNQVYAFNHEGEFTLKRAEKRANRWYLVSENPDQSKYPPVPCTESTALIGKVVLMQAEQV